MLNSKYRRKLRNIYIQIFLNIKLFGGEIKATIFKLHVPDGALQIFGFYSSRRFQLVNGIFGRIKWKFAFSFTKFIKFNLFACLFWCAVCYRTIHVVFCFVYTSI